MSNVSTPGTSKRRRHPDGAYFRFPLAVFSMGLEATDLWMAVVSYCAVHNGRKRLERIDRGEPIGKARRPSVRALNPQTRDSWTSAAEFLHWVCGTGPFNDQSNRIVIPDDYDPLDRRHRGVLCALAPANTDEGVPVGGLAYRGVAGLRVPSIAYLIEQYEVVEAHVRAQAEATGLEASRMPNVTFRYDVFHDIAALRSRRSLKPAEARVLAAVYSAVGDKETAAVSLEKLRYRADGYRSRTAFEAAMRAAGAIPDPDISVGLLEPVPDGFRRERRRAGFLRYDEAVGFLRTQRPDGPSLVARGVALTGSGGAFDVVPTPEGVVFALRDEFALPEGTQMRTGNRDPNEFYTSGDRVVYTRSGVDGLFLGTIVRVGNHVVVKRGERKERLRRAECFVTPAHYVGDLVEAAEVTPRAAQVLEAPEPSLSLKRVRTLTATLGRLRFYQRVQPGRGKPWVYSITLDEDEIAERVADRVDHKEREAERGDRTRRKVEAAVQARRDRRRA